MLYNFRRTERTYRGGSLFRSSSTCRAMGKRASTPLISKGLPRPLMPSVRLLTDLNSVRAFFITCGQIRKIHLEFARVWWGRNQVSERNLDLASAKVGVSRVRKCRLRFGGSPVQADGLLLGHSFDQTLSPSRPPSRLLSK